MKYIEKQMIAVNIAITGLVIAVVSLFGTTVRLVGLAFILFNVVLVVMELVKYHKREKKNRGRELLTFKEAKKRCELSPSDRGIQFGCLRIPTANAKNHFCIVGASGSGKTLTIRMLLRDQLPLIKKGTNRRAIIYDAKQDMVQIIGSIINLGKPPCSIYLLNPFDKRGSSWKMAADVTTETLAQELATALIPDTQESNPFFTDSVRVLITAVLRVFMKRAPGKWTFRELILVMTSKEKLQKLLSSDPRTQSAVANIFGSGEKTVGSIMATVMTKLGKYNAIAAAWERTAHSVSITKWLNEASIIVLGNHEQIRSSLDAVNQLFVKIASQHILSQEDSDRTTDGLTWLIFDEFREAGELPGLENLILRGRSKSCAVVLGFQDIQGVHHVYDEARGNEIVGQCGNKAFLRIESPETAKWAADTIGEREAFEYEASYSTSVQGTTESQADRKQTRYAVMASEFQSMPVKPETEGLHGVYLVRNVGAYRATYTPEEIATYVGTLDRSVKPNIEVPSSYQELLPWNDEDDAKYGISKSEPPKEPPSNHEKESTSSREKAPNPPGGGLNDMPRMDC